MEKLYAALSDHAGVIADTEARMVAVLDELRLTALACSIESLSPVGASEALGLTADQRTELEAAARRSGTPPEPPTRGVPRQLPPEVAHFTGREATTH